MNLRTKTMLYSLCLCRFRRNQKLKIPIARVPKQMSVNLLSSDGHAFPVPLSMIGISGLLMDLSSDEDMPLNEIDQPTLERIVRFLHLYSVQPMPDIEKPIRSSDFSTLVPSAYNELVSIDHEMLFKLASGANYMDIQPLLDLTCAKIASMIKDKTADEIRETFSIENDFTPEEEEAIREEYKWCEESI